MMESGVTTCTARWATASAYHRQGDLCGDPAVETIGDVDLCWHHYQRALHWFYQRSVELPEKVQREAAEARLRAAHQERIEAEARSIVYAVRRSPDGLIKIGTTARYQHRMAALRHEHGELRLFLAMPGGRREEMGIHGRFTRLRVEGEWFRPERPLLWWILRMRGQHNFRETRLPKAVPLREIRGLMTQPSDP